MALDWQHRSQSAVARLVALGQRLEPAERAELTAIVGELAMVVSHVNRLLAEA